jgi:[acyl-carrier-protein] S-malonyltransferase
VVQAVNFNEPKQTVIAGHKAAVERAAEAGQGARRQACADAAGVGALPLRLMQPAADALKSPLANRSACAPQFPVVNNVDVAQRIDPEAIRDALVRQAASPVRWVETMQAMQAAGVTHVFECGPGKVLAGLVKRCVDGLTGGR